MPYVVSSTLNAYQVTVPSSAAASERALCSNSARSSLLSGFASSRARTPNLTAIRSPFVGSSILCGPLSPPSHILGAVDASLAATRCALAQMRVCGIEGNGKLAWISARLGQEQTALDRRHRRGRERGNVGAPLQFSARLHRLESSQKRALPTVE